jgi:hypothetical protein
MGRKYKKEKPVCSEAPELTGLVRKRGLLSDERIKLTVIIP